MTPAFAQWIEHLFRRRLQRPGWLHYFTREWTASQPTNSWIVAERIIDGVGGFTCCDCLLSFFVDGRPAYAAICKEGRLCFRCAHARGLVKERAR